MAGLEAMISALREPYDWRSLGVRVVSSAVLAPLTLWATYTGGWPFLVLLSVAAACLAIEWAVMSAPRSPARIAVAISLTIFAGAVSAQRFGLGAALAAMFVGAGVSAAFAKRLSGRPLDAAYGAVYIGLPILAMMGMRLSHNGLQWTFFTFAVAWASDSAAYLIGSLAKGPKLWPEISPNKTWAGFAGGMVFGVIAADACAELSGVFTSITAAAIAGLIGAFATMCGDLWESLLKRRYGVKDSGHLIPGHGGLLDRVDGLMFATVAISALRVIFAIGGWA